MDALHDNSHRTWIQLADTYETFVPSYVQEYTLPDKEAASKIPDTLFADPARRLFPIDSKEAVWLSAAYFAKNSESLPYDEVEREYVHECIKAAAAVYGNESDVGKIMKVVTDKPVEKQAEDNNDNYGWVMRSEDGTVLARKYPMFDKTGVCKAAQYFDEFRQNYPIGIRRTISRNIMRKAAEFGIKTAELKPSVLREAGYGIPRKDVLMEEIYERAHLAKDAESAVLLANVNELIAGMDDTTIGENLDKIAEVIDAFDNAAGLQKLYNVKILMPSDFLFDVDLNKAAEAVEDTVILNRYCFSLNKLAELEPSVFESVLGEDFAKSICKTANGKAVIDAEKLADNLHSLPKPDKAALERHLAATL